METELTMIDLVGDVDVREISPLILAHIGDAYFHLYVRVRLLERERRVHELHERSATIVSAVNQAHAYRVLEERLTDEERDIFRRGRNAKSHLTRSATAADYHTSTGFEALLGALFLRRDYERLNEIAATAFDVLDKKISLEEENQ